MNNLIAIHAIVSTHNLSQAAEKTERFGPHSQADIGIGDDHTAALTFDDEALIELDKLLKQEQRDCTFGQAIEMARATGRRICRAHEETSYITVGRIEDSVRDVLFMHHPRWPEPKLWAPRQEDVLADDWVVIIENPL